MIDTAENPWIDDDLIAQRRRQRRWLRSVATFVLERRRGPVVPEVATGPERTLAERLLRDHVDAELADVPPEWETLVDETTMRNEAIRALGVPDSFIHSMEGDVMHPLLDRYPRPSTPTQFDDAALSTFFQRIVMPLAWADGLAGDGYQDQRIRLAEPRV